MIELADAKLHLRLIDSRDDADSYTAEDTLIQALIDAAVRYAENHTQARIASPTVSKVLDGFPAQDGAIELPWSPVIAIESLEYVDPEGVEQTLDASTLRLDTRPIMPTLSPQYGSDWPRTIDEPESVTISATVGYETIPPDIRVALLLLVGHWYENREQVITGAITSEVPMGVAALLAPYRIHAVG
ncbi:head-tail connector protein [Chromohalobacter moromii]|uniref:Head-tail connector protein n=1 Tax=Chromohalobacter moromii TaxID=2860329 RepID=A0A9X3AY24_9GAMM|nr:head-tail connector protein [Chromohalobacter moromii]MCT8506142.1 head-tail connector protein [Chromohalobacter moromii]